MPKKIEVVMVEGKQVNEDPEAAIDAILDEVLGPEDEDADEDD